MVIVTAEVSKSNCGKVVVVVVVVPSSSIATRDEKMKKMKHRRAENRHPAPKKFRFLACNLPVTSSRPSQKQTRKLSEIGDSGD